jgi:acetolactate synthase-1/2/3 large subunit
MNVSEYIAYYLKRSKISTVYELSGGMIMHLLDAVHREGGIRIVNVYHEQSAAFAADATGRLSGIPGVAFGTSGPGAINLLTGVGSSYFDSSPTVFITGQVNRHEQKGDKKIRQLGFQETDIVSMAKPITKWAERVTQPSEIPSMLQKAFSIATEGRPGSVLLDIPMDVFRGVIPKPFLDYEPPTQIKPNLTDTIESLFEELSLARRPLILAGAGIRASQSHSHFLEFLKRTSLPVVYSLLACDCLEFSHPQRIGMIGTYGNRWANLALSESDLLLVLGSRLDIRQTGADTVSFKNGRRIFHVDIEDGEMNNRISGCDAIHANLPHFFEIAIPHASEVYRPDWNRRIEILRQEWPDTDELKGIRGINPNHILHEISRGQDAGAYCVDVGLHQMWAAQSLELQPGTRFLTSGGMGAMGFALPAAVGAAFYHNCARPVVVIAGDGGFQLNIQELQNIALYSLPIKIVVLNNHCHGMTRQFQDTYFGARYTGTVWGYSAPSFYRIADAYGIPSKRITDSSQITAAVNWLWSEPLQPMLLEVEIDLHTNAYPKLAFGRPISEMEPMAKPIEMEAT